MKFINNNLRFPVFTLLLNVTTLVVSLYFILTSTPGNKHLLLRKLGAPDAFYVYSGEWWGIITNTFTHSHTILLLFNLVGLWILGAFLERRAGWISLLLLGTFASLITSIVQLNLIDDPGLGMSAVNFFLLGFIILKSRHDERFSFALWPLAVVTGIAGIVLIIISNQYYASNIGLQAIFSGLISGAVFGIIKPNRIRIALGILLSITAFTTLIYAPWSATWNFTKAVKYHQENRLKEAERYYGKTLQIDPTMDDARYNLILIQIDRLSDEAYELHRNKHFQEARKVYLQILELDPQNHWAKQQIKALP